MAFIKMIREVAFQNEHGRMKVFKKGVEYLVTGTVEVYLQKHNKPELPRRTDAEIEIAAKGKKFGPGRYMGSVDMWKQTKRSKTPQFAALRNWFGW